MAKVLVQPLMQEYPDLLYSQLPLQLGHLL